MAERPRQESEAEIQEHGPEHWFSKWERQCLAEAEQDDPGEEGAGQSQQELWHLFQNSATAVAQLYKDRVCQQQQSSIALWGPFQTAATAVTNLYRESVNTQQCAYELGVQRGQQRRGQEVLSWVKKRRRTIRREELISFLCGKAPPPRPARATPRIAMVTPSRPSPADTGSSPDTDLTPFREAIALHGLSGAMASISVRSSSAAAPGSPTALSSSAPPCGRRRNCGPPDADLNTFICEEMARHMGPAPVPPRKRPPAPPDTATDSPTHKRNRLA